MNTSFHSPGVILYGSLHPVQGLQLRLSSFYYAGGVIDVRQFARKTRLIGSFQLLLDFFKSTQDLTEFRAIRRSVHSIFPLQSSTKGTAKNAKSKRRGRRSKKRFLCKHARKAILIGLLPLSSLTINIIGEKFSNLR